MAISRVQVNHTHISVIVRGATNLPLSLIYLGLSSSFRQGSRGFSYRIVKSLREKTRPVE